MFWKILELLIPIVGAAYVVPQAVRSISRGNSKGISKYMIVGWVANNALSLIYVLHLGDLSLSIKYTICLFLISIVAWYKRID